MIRLNRVHGEFDYDILANEFQDDDLFQWGFKDTDLGIDMPNIEEKSQPSSKKKKHICPQCGHEFSNNDIFKKILCNRGIRCIRKNQCKIRKRKLRQLWTWRWTN